jgi:hypothetical protein
MLVRNLYGNIKQRRRFLEARPNPAFLNDRRRSLTVAATLLERSAAFELDEVQGTERNALTWRYLGYALGSGMRQSKFEPPSNDAR